MKTVLHSYKFDIRNDAEYAEYNALHSTLRAAGLECFRTLAPSPIGKEINHRALDGKEVELETKHLFDNQWNSAPGTGGSENGWRLFDWCEPIYPNENLRTGYWLEQTDEMKSIRSNTAKCGYCGAMAPVGAMEFCDKCIDSEYLTEKGLHLTRMVPIEYTNNSRAKLTYEESVALLPKYKDAQIHGATDRGKARIAKAYADCNAQHKRALISAENEYKGMLISAENEYKGMLWILDNCPGLAQNAIYYTHTGRWCFGWRTPIGPSMKDEVSAMLAEFPLPYDIK